MRASIHYLLLLRISEMKQNNPDIKFREKPYSFSLYSIGERKYIARSISQGQETIERGFFLNFFPTNNHE